MKTNITLRVDEQLAREAKVLAAKRRTSVSQLVAQHLEELVKRENQFDKARKRALKRLARGYDLNWQRPEDRGEIYER